jgi:hypothetical protein
MIDPSALLGKLFEEVAKKVGSGTLALALGGTQKIADTLRLNFSEYLTSAIERTSRIKTLLHRDEPVNLFTIYVDAFFKSNSKTITEDTLVKRIRESASILVVGTAGSGKTMFIKHLFQELIEGSFGIIPIYIELRSLNFSDYKGDLIQFIYESVVRPGAVITKDQFTDGLRENMFTLILDGLDEVEHDRRPEVEYKIKSLRDAYPDLGIVVTSRLDERLTSWPEFSVYHIEPMKKAQVLTLVRKMPYDVKVRSRFCREVDEHLYREHQSFLSNPLLATMMLMTYDQFAHIPEKIHLFYEQAFETLFLKHDAVKGAGFRRKMYTDLALNDFRNCLSALCARSYFKEQFQFTDAQLLDYIAQALEFEKKTNIKGHDFAKDLLESVCVLQREGLHISFTHRTFQEYFAAVFISRGPSAPPIGDLLDSFSRRPDDSVISMAFDMNRDLVEREWVLPRITDLAGRLEYLDPVGDIGRYVEFILGRSVMILDSRGETSAIFTRPPLVRVLRKLYNEIFKSEFSSDSEISVGLHSFPKEEHIKIPDNFRIQARIGANYTILNLDEYTGKWLMDTSCSSFVKNEIDELLKLKHIVETSVTEQKRLGSWLFA